MYLQCASRARATVSAIADEIHMVKPEDFDILSTPQRLQQTGDLFAGVLNTKQSLDYVLKQLGITNPAEARI